MAIWYGKDKMKKSLDKPLQAVRKLCCKSDADFNDFVDKLYEIQRKYSCYTCSIKTHIKERIQINTIEGVPLCITFFDGPYRSRKRLYYSAHINDVLDSFENLFEYAQMHTYLMSRSTDGKILDRDCPSTSTGAPNTNVDAINAIGYAASLYRY